MSCELATPRTYQAMIAVGRGLFAALRLRPRVAGAEHLSERGGAVLAITHFGYLDFALTEWVVWRHNRRWIRFLATSAAFAHPLSGPLLRAMRHVPVNRADGSDAYRHAVEAARAGHLVGLFPEGQVTRDWDEVLPCAGGAVRIAAAAGVPLVPVAVWGGHRVLTKIHRFSPQAARGATISVRVGRPVAVTQEQAGREAGPWLRSLLQDLMIEAQDDYPDQPRGDVDRWWLPNRLAAASSHERTSDPRDESSATG